MARGKRWRLAFSARARFMPRALVGAAKKGRAGQSFSLVQEDCAPDGTRRAGLGAVNEPFFLARGPLPASVGVALIHEPHGYFP